MTPQRRAQRSLKDCGSLEVFVCSMIDRGVNTAYALQREAGLSLGSTIPALARLETSGYVKKKIVGAGKRVRHTYRLSASGRKLARTGWRRHLERLDARDVEHVLRLVDLAAHYGAPTEEVREFLERAAGQKLTGATLAAKERDEMSDAFFYGRAKCEFDGYRLAAEGKLLRSLALQFSTKAPRKAKGRKAPTIS